LAAEREAVAERKQLTFEYQGPPVVVVELGIEVTNGDVIRGPAALEHTAGFTQTKRKPTKGPGASAQTKDGDE